MKKFHYEIYTNQYYNDEPLCIVTNPMPYALRPYELIEGVSKVDEEGNVVSVIGDGDQWIEIGGVFIQRKHVLYVKEITEGENE